MECLEGLGSFGTGDGIMKNGVALLPDTKEDTEGGLNKASHKDR